MPLDPKKEYNYTKSLKMIRWFTEIRVYSLLVVYMYYFKLHNFFLLSTVSLILLEVPSPPKIAVWYSIFITHRFLENYIYIDITKCMGKNKRGGMVVGVIFFYCWTLTKQKDFKYIVVLSKQKHTLWLNVSFLMPAWTSRHLVPVFP